MTDTTTTDLADAEPKSGPQLMDGYMIDEDDDGSNEGALLEPAATAQGSAPAIDRNAESERIAAGLRMLEEQEEAERLYPDPFPDATARYVQQQEAIASQQEVQTGNPCPSWCTERPGHGYECDGNHGEQIRYHGLTIGRVHVTGLLDSVLGRYGCPTVTVSIDSEEAAFAGKVIATAPRIVLHSDAKSSADITSWLNADEAREIANLLTTAAERLSEINPEK
jgi:hypothetical protein